MMSLRQSTMAMSGRVSNAAVLGSSSARLAKCHDWSYDLVIQMGPRRFHLHIVEVVADLIALENVVRNELRTNVSRRIPQLELGRRDDPQRDRHFVRINSFAHDDTVVRAAGCKETDDECERRFQACCFISCYAQARGNSAAI